MSKPKLNLKEESSAKKTRSPHLSFISRHLHFFAAIRFYNNHPAVGFQDVFPKFYDFYYIKTGVPMLFFSDRFVLYYSVF